MIKPYYRDERVTLYHGDCLQVLADLPDASVDAVVTDPPYGLAFMGKKWDYDVPSVEIWQQVLRVLKPGGHLLAFAGTRTQHRMAVRIEDAGFEIRDMIAWVYGSGFPKSLDVSKAIDKRGGTQVAWFGPWFRKWRRERGISSNLVAKLFPSASGGVTGCVRNWELGLNMPTPEQFNLIRDTFGLPFDSVEEAEREVVGQKRTGDPVAWYAQAERGDGFVDITAPATEAAKQWQGWGTAIAPAMEPVTMARKPLGSTVAECLLKWGTGALNIEGTRNGERLAKNVIHDGSDDAEVLFPEGAARFFYTAKADASERRGSKHPTVKPLDLMRYLVRLVCPVGGVVLDPFSGSGTTIEAARDEHCRSIAIELNAEYLADTLERLRQGVLF